MDQSQSQTDSDEDKAMASLLAARRCLTSCLDRSRSLASALSRAGPHLEEIKHRLPSLEASVRPIRAPREALMEVGGHIDRAVGPAAAVLKVFDAVHGLERPLLSGDGPAEDLKGFLDVLTRLEEALKFLSDNSGLAVQWLDDIVEYLADHSLADPRFISQLTDTLSSLKSGSGTNQNLPEPLDGGLLSATLDRLELEFCQLLSAHSNPIPLQPPENSGDTAIAIAPSPLPVPVVRKLSLILDRLAANNCLDKCVSAFVDIRGSNVRKSLEALGIDYLGSPLDDAQMLGPHVQRWGRHLEFAVKHLLESEHRVCTEVFDRRPADSAYCFAEVAAQAGILDFIKFGRTVADAKKDPIKLLRLLEIFDSLNKLRLDFNRLFGSKACADIQNRTRDLIKRVVEGACEIFGELLVQVELQRNVTPPPDGGVPRLVSFITEYCNRLLSDEYRPVLTQVLIIQRSWKQERFHERLLIEAMLNLVKALELNFETWSKGYEDPNLACLFMMNTHWHFFKHLKGTRLGDHLGDTWLREHEQYKDYHVAVFLRETWGKLPGLLSREGLMIFSGGRATARDLVKKRLKSFNEMFNEMYQTQSNWVISDKELRDKMCSLVVQAIVPVYRSYMQNYGPLVEQDASASKYAKFTAQGLEKMLGSLFQNKPKKAASFNVRHSNGKVNHAGTGLYRSTSTVK
ncbi:exocyst subunit exo70 family protein G1 [Rhynchospora pubera]|uniref:Exocyst subunit Exo70 family protein n=1 Tax=Rhynchospora pubera TaxID=906938 RepID=A0AAV8D836_9POAL|nr:exocyst subunit exo70 family protein G1 [Rhynchospora pubera]